MLWAEVARSAIQGQPVRVLRTAFDAAKLAQVAHVLYGPSAKTAVVHYEDHISVAARLPSLTL